MNPKPQRSPSPVPLLDSALLLALELLVARHPDLLLPDDVPRLRPPPSLRAARAIVGLIEILLGELARYSELDIHGDAVPALRNHRAPEHVAAAPVPDDDIPF
jgi:hypothetical protein